MPRSRIKRWNTAYAALKDYRKEHPSEWPPWNYVAPDGLRLGLWCHNQRAFRKRRALAPERVRKLKNIGFPWMGTALRTRWERAFDALKRFSQKHGHCRPPEPCVDGGVNLQNWCHQQRGMNKKGNLHPDRVKKLNSIGFKWGFLDAAWERGFTALKLYRHRQLVARGEPEDVTGRYRLK